MFLYIIRTNDVSLNTCNNFANILCQNYPDIVVRVIDDSDKSVILASSTTGIDIYISNISKGPIEVYDSNKDIFAKIPIDCTGEQLFNASQMILGKMITLNPVYWGKDEKGWWYRAERMRSGGIAIMSINQLWYCIDEDMYMLTGWQPVEIDEKISCMYFDTVLGHAIESPNTAGMPDPLAFPYPPIKVKWY